MRTSSLAPPRNRETTRIPATDKKIPQPAPPSVRRLSVQQNMNRTNHKFRETGLLRPKKCPNCGKAFPNDQYTNHAKHCFRYREETPIVASKSKLKPESFRIKKVKGKIDEILEKKEKVQIPVPALPQNLPEPRQLQKVEREQQFQIDGFIRKDERVSEEPIRDSEGNEITNVEQIEGIRDAIDEEETGVVRRRPQLPPQLPQPRRRETSPDSDSSISYSRENTRNVPQPSTSIRYQQPPRIPSPPRLVERPRQPQRHEQNVRSEEEPNPELDEGVNLLQRGLNQIMEGVNINEMLVLIGRIPFLRENPLIVERVNNLRNFITSLNVMLGLNNIAEDQINTVRNVLEFFVGEITHIMTIIMSARIGMMIYMVPPATPGFTPEEISTKFPARPHNSDCETCSICINDFQRGESTISLRCKHEFHVECIAEWLKNSINCPVCRAEQS